jgi:Holliday junction DNA helicase RuvA
MFAFLRGRVAAKPLNHIQLDVNGVGYLVFVPASVRSKLVVDREATLLTYCHIREDSFQIFGFLQEEQKALFIMLLSVSGIGPKVALSILSDMAPSTFGHALRQSDVTAFTKVSGVGKKTAQRLILEMKAKLGQDAELDAILGGESDEESFDGDDVVAALLALGSTPTEAKRAAARARKNSTKNASDEDLVRTALQSLAKV